MNERIPLILAALRAKRKRANTPFPEQQAFVDDPSQDVAALCTRRAGKTNGFALRFHKTMTKHPGCMCPYIALTRESAKNIMWPVLHELNDKFDWKAQFTESNLTMTLPNTSKLQLFGADMKNFIRRLRGIKTPGAGIDEAQEFGDHLETLVDDILKPATADYAQDGWIALGGTPGPIPRGYFYDITQGGKYGYSLHRWSLYQNPFMPNPKGFVAALQKKKEWAPDHPTLLREYFGQWVLDTESLLIKYDQSRNHYDELPRGNWQYILGVDIGHRDADALAVLAWHDRTPNIYLVEEVITRGQDITELSNQIEALQKRFDIGKIVMDEGALGKKIAEEIRRRRGIPVQPADKMRKMENAAFLNDYLRMGKFKAKKDSRFAQESYQIQIDYERSTPDRLVVKKGFHSDIIDSVLYAFKESPAWAHQEPRVKPKVGTQEWFNEEEDELEKAAFANAQRNDEPSFDNGWGDEWK